MRHDEAVSTLVALLSDAEQWVREHRDRRLEAGESVAALVAERLLTFGVARAYGLSICDDAGNELDR